MLRLQARTKAGEYRWTPGSVLAAVLLILSAGGQALGLTDEEIYRDLRFNLINPGARSLALGGAFVSLADDATAAQANPAGLAILRKLEVFSEIRHVDNGGETIRLRERLPTAIRTFVASGSDLEDVTSPTFLSVVVPLEDSPWTIGFSRQEVLNTEVSTLSSFAFTFPGQPGAFLVEGKGFLDLEVANLNLSVGFEVSDHLAVGASLSLARLDMTSEVENFVVDTAGNIADCEVLAPTLQLRTRTGGEDGDLTFSIGVIAQPNPRLGFGAVLRRGARLSVDQRFEPGTDPCTGAGAFDPFDEPPVADTFPNRLHLPDSYGFGFHVRPIVGPGRILTLAVNAEKIYYSNLLDGYGAGVNALTSPDAVFTVDDGVDVRLGAEYAFFKGGVLLMIRGGGFSESDSTIRAVSTGDRAFATPDAFPGRDRQTHVTAGFGIGWKRQQYKIDLAADFADSDNEYLVSFIYRGK